VRRWPWHRALWVTVCLNVFSLSKWHSLSLHGDTPPSKICLSSLALSALTSQPADRGTHREAADPPRRRGIARCLAQRRADRTPSLIGRLPVISCHARHHHPAYGQRSVPPNTHTHTLHCCTFARSLNQRANVLTPQLATRRGEQQPTSKCEGSLGEPDGAPHSRTTPSRDQWGQVPKL
jgi:hypothetical protein